MPRNKETMMNSTNRFARFAEVVGSLIQRRASASRLRSRSALFAFAFALCVTGLAVTYGQPYTLTNAKCQTLSANANCGSCNVASFYQTASMNPCGTQGLRWCAMVSCAKQASNNYYSNCIYAAGANPPCTEKRTYSYAPACLICYVISCGCADANGDCTFNAANCNNQAGCTGAGGSQEATWNIWSYCTK
jgi:hypothetical protein